MRPATERNPLPRVALTALALASFVACGAGGGERPSVRLQARPPALTAGTGWTATLVVTPASSGRPALVARSGAARRTFATTPAGRGRYRARLLFARPGRWSLEARLRGRTFRLGAVTVRAAQPPAPVAEVTEPFAVAVDRDGRVLVADRAANRLVRIDPATAALAVVAEVPEPLDVAVGPDGGAYVVAGERVLRVDTRSGAVTPVAGTGTRGFGGDGGPATAAPLNAVGGIALDRAGNLYIAEYENRIRRVDAATRVITTIAGTGAEGFAGDGGPATAARVFHPHGLTVAADGSLLVADTENNRIRRIDPQTGTITTIAGTGAEGLRGDGGPAVRATLGIPLHVAPGPDGSLYLVDDGRVRRIDASGTIRTVAGNGLPGSGGDGGPATRASLHVPNHVAVAPDGTFYVTEFEGRRVRRVDGATGVITTLAR